jgi:hypothetical protein
MKVVLYCCSFVISDKHGDGSYFEVTSQEPCEPVQVCARVMNMAERENKKHVTCAQLLLLPLLLLLLLLLLLQEQCFHICSKYKI